MKKQLSMGAVLLSAAILSGCMTAELGAVSYETLTKKDLKNTLTLSGKVESTQSCNVYSMAGYPVKELLVSAGDRVQAGDILCYLDSADLEEQIALREANLESSSKSAYLQLAQNEKRYEDAKKALEQGENGEVLNAKSALYSAEAELSRAKKQYDDARKNISDEDADALTELGNELSSAEWNRDIAKDKFQDLLKKEADRAKIEKLYAELEQAKLEQREADAAVKSAAADGNEITKLSKKLKEAKQKCQNKTDALEDLLKGDILYAFYESEGMDAQVEALKTQMDEMLSGMNGEIAVARQALEAAELAAERAKLSVTIADRSAESQLAELSAALEQSRLAISETPSLLELASMRRKLEDCTITAPVSGIITGITAEVGTPANGILFVIQDTENLKISASVQEYDIGELSVGQSVTITSEALSGKSYEGVLDRISAAGVSSSDSMVYGNTAETAAFPAEVSIQGNTELKIGMNVKLKVVSAERKDVFAVRFDMITEDEDGQSYVFVADDDGKGNYTARRIPVTIGMETNLEAEISGGELTEGMKILTGASQLTDGQPVVLAE